MGKYEADGILLLNEAVDLKRESTHGIDAWGKFLFRCTLRKLQGADSSHSLDRHASLEQKRALFESSPSRDGQMGARCPPDVRAGELVWCRVK